MAASRKVPLRAVKAAVQARNPVAAPPVPRSERPKPPRAPRAPRALQAAETAVKGSISAAADDGDRRELLVALRSRIAKSVDDMNTPARDLAALSRRLLEIAREIEAIDAEDMEDDIGSAAATPDEEWAAN